MTLNLEELTASIDFLDTNFSSYRRYTLENGRDLEQPPSFEYFKQDLVKNRIDSISKIITATATLQLSIVPTEMIDNKKTKSMLDEYKKWVFEFMSYVFKQKEENEIAISKTIRDILSDKTHTEHKLTFLVVLGTSYYLKTLNN